MDFYALYVFSIKCLGVPCLCYYNRIWRKATIIGRRRRADRLPWDYKIAMEIDYDPVFDPKQVNFKKKPKVFVYMYMPSMRLKLISADEEDLD